MDPPLPSPDPETEFQRVFYCDGEFICYKEDYRSLKDHAIEQVIKLYAMSPPLPVSKFYQCQLDECNKWTINNRKSRKHWFCSKRCYDLWKKREERSTPEKRKAYNKRQKQYYRDKVLGKTLK